MINGVQAYFENEGREKNERSNIHLIGRLDKETSGILGIAKNSVTAERMIKQRQRGILIKEYGYQPGPDLGEILTEIEYAIVDGELANEKEAIIAYIQQVKEEEK